MRAHLPRLPASIFSFAEKNRKEGSPRYIHYALSQMVVAHHSGDVQVLCCDLIVPAHEIERSLVVKIGSLPRDLLVPLSPAVSRP
jgi:hypothetical protein